MSQPRRRVIRNQKQYWDLVRHIREHREMSGYTQASVAQGINLSRSQYTSIEAGRSMPSYDTLVSLAKFYGKRTSAFISESE